MIRVDSSVVTKSYRDLYNTYVKQNGSKPIDLLGISYNAIRAFFEFLDGQKTMDTTEWVKGFEKYQWKGVFGQKAHWIVKPIYGINRMQIPNVWASEWKNGKLETSFTANIPYELFESK